jgi:signal transduction histidine kinase
VSGASSGAAGDADGENGIVGQRKRLALRANALMLVQAAVLLYLRRWRGPAIWAPGIVLLGILAYGQLAIPAGGIRAFVYRWTLVFYLNAALAYWGLSYPGDALPPTLYLFINNSLFFQLSWGPRVGWASYVLAIAGLVAVHAGRGVWEPYEERIFLGLLLATTVMQATAQAYESAFKRLWSRNQDLAAALEREAAERQKAVSQLLDQLERPLANAFLRPAELAAALEVGLGEARALRDALPPPPEPIDDGATVPQRLLEPLLWLGLLVGLGLGLRDLALEPSEAFISLGVAACLGVLVLLIRVRASAWRPVALATLLAGVWGIVMGILHTRPVHLPEALVYGQVVLVFAALWLGPAAALVVGLLLAGLDFWWLWSFSAQMPRGQIDGGVNLLQQWLMISIVLAPAARAQQRLLDGLERQSRSVAASLRVRRRLLGTLFHDAANHVLAMSSLVQLTQEGLADSEDAGRFERLRARLRTLVSSARLWLLDDRDFGPAELEAVDLQRLAADAEELFRERLRAKELRWAPDLAPGLRVRAHAGLLGDGVLGNLLSNAIKFSPRGGALQLKVWKQGPMACLSVHDEGPGLSEDQVASFAAGQDLATRPGTEGEPGQGLGLGLAREHLRRMGGSLELRPAGPEGGGELRLWLPLA